MVKSNVLEVKKYEIFFPVRCSTNEAVISFRKMKKSVNLDELDQESHGRDFCVKRFRRGMNMSNHLYLPQDLEDASIDLVIFRCNKYLGNEVGKFVDQLMRQKVGENWLKELSILRQEFNINISDPLFILKEPLYSDSPLRKVLPKSETFYRNLESLKRLRNKIYHNNFDGDIDQAIVAVQWYFDIASDLQLQSCANQFAKLLLRLKDLKQGKKSYSDIHEKEAIAEQEKIMLEDQIVELNEKIQESHSKSLNLESEMRMLEKRFRNESSNLGKTTVELEKLRELLKAKEINELKLYRQSEIEREKIAEIEAERDSLLEVSTLLTNIVMKDIDFDNALMKDRKNASESHLTGDLNSEIGQLWNGERGKKKFVLSAKKQDLIDPKTELPVIALDESAKKSWVEKSLRIRPTGGRIFVDSSGNSTTLIGNQLIYLGNIGVFLS